MPIRALRDLKAFVLTHPGALSRLGPRRESAHYMRRVVRPSDDLVIEGYPRSANTFATHAFVASQPGPIRIGNHFHSPAQFLLARQYTLPAMLVIREPLAAASSMIVYDPTMSLDEALGRYIIFHRPLLAAQDAFLVACFEEVTTDFGMSIDRLNHRFGTTFHRPVHDEAFTKAVFQRIADAKAARDAALVRSGTGANRLTVPDGEKDRLRTERLDTQQAKPSTLAAARRLYHAIVENDSSSGEALVAPRRR